MVETPPPKSEHRDQAGRRYAEPKGQQLDRFDQDFLGGWVPGSVGLTDDRGGLPPSTLPPARSSMADFEAAPRGASRGRGGRWMGLRRTLRCSPAFRKRNVDPIVDAAMTAFGRGACVAVVDPAIQDNASADAGADASVKNVLVAAACTPEGLGERGCVPSLSTRTGTL